MRERIIVAIDGPAGAGKSSVTRALAARLGLAVVDTGAIYRCVALAALRAGVGLSDDAGLGALIDGLQIDLHLGADRSDVSLAGESVAEAIRAPDVTAAASQVSSRGPVRSRLLPLQRGLALGAPRGAVLEGRDIGTVVFPDASFKFFLSARPEVRAARRLAELRERGLQCSLEEVLEAQVRRDAEDSRRALAPLVPAPDAVLVDSSDLPLEAVVAQMERVVRAGGGV